MKRPSKLLLLAIGLILAAALCSVYLFSRSPSTPSSEVPVVLQQKDFVQYVDKAQLQNKTLVYESDSPLCTSSSSGNSATDCTLSKTFIYKLDGNYRENGKEIFAYLKSKGFDFRPGDKYESQVAERLNNTRLTDNLSNSEPVIVDLYNSQGNVRVRVNLGDLGRTMPYVKGQGVDTLSADQLIAGLEFLSP